MAENLGTWPSKRGPIAKFVPSDVYKRDAVPLAVVRWYDFHDFGCHPGNPGLGYNDSSNSQTFRKMKNVIINTLMVLISLILGLLMLEIGSRLYSGSKYVFQYENYISRHLNLFESAYLNAYHSNLGYIPRPGTAGVSNPWGTTNTVLEHGIRSNGGNGASHNARDATILAVGDSFTFGDQVSDDETWPAYLDTIVKQKVINGGVFGYGLDQTVLRAEELANIFNVEILVVSFTPDDINRTQLSMRTGVSKPYFVVDEGQLVRKNRPVPQARPAKNRIGLLRSIVGYSHLMHKVALRLGLGEWWLVGNFRSQKAHSQGMQVSCLLTKRLRTLAVETGARIVIVAQFAREIVFDDQESSEKLVRSHNFLDCAKSNSLETLDLYQPLLKIYQSDSDLYNSFYDGHMTAAGNRFVAEQIARYLGRR